MRDAANQDSQGWEGFNSRVKITLLFCCDLMADMQHSIFQSSGSHI